MGAIRANKHGYLFLDFYYQNVRCRERTGLRDNQRNRSALEKKLGIIEREIALGIFDYVKWFPDGNKAAQFGVQKPEDVRAASYLDEWFNAYKHTVKPYTAQCYEGTIDARIKPWLESKTLQDISRRAVKELVSEWLDEGLSVRTVKNYVKPLRQALEDAVEDGLLESNPARGLKLPKASPPNVDPLSFEEMTGYLEAVPSSYRPYFETAFLTGMRPSEQIALKRKYVDLRQRSISVRESRVHDHEGPPKTTGSIRDVEVLDPLLPVLEAQLRRSEDSEYLFPSTAGGPLDRGNLRERVWYPTLEEAGLRRRVMYQTRHTFASLMISSGEDINWVARMMGDKVETVLRHYNRFVPREGRHYGSTFLAAYEVAQRLPKKAVKG